MTKRVLSGVQPTGNLHLGNYLGAIKNWVAMQDSFEELLFCIVDLHAITVQQDPKELLYSTRKTAATYIACGINIEKSAIFHQSSVAQHAELAWLLSTFTPIGWLNRMTQFKEKSGKNKDKSNLGLYSYPVLMAADILLYNATHIPVGEDQKQHLELTRDIAGAFNRAYNNEFFKLPEPIITGDATRVMSLKDGTKKMSKSAESDNSRINLTDTADEIVMKIKKAKSDIVQGVSYDEANRPEISNLINIFASISGVDKQKIVEKYASSSISDFKKDLADILVFHLEPISKKIDDLMNNQDYLDQILQEGSKKSSDIATQNISKVKNIMGFLQV